MSCELPFSGAGVPEFRAEQSFKNAMKTGQIKYCWRVSGLVASSLLGAVVGCTDADQTGLYEPNPDWSNLQKHENTAVVGAEGAIIVAGEAAITIPSGALAEPVEITVQPVEDYPSAAQIPEEQVFAFLPHGTQFLQPVTITVPHAHTETDSLALYTSEPDVP